MNIEIANISKRFKREWILKNLNYSVKSGEKIGIIGSNGSGKSTLLKLISGAEIPTSGKITYAEGKISEEDIYTHLNFVAPYIDIPEELTLKELLRFHSKFKSLEPSLSEESLIKLLYLEEVSNKLVGNYSSGMKQRLKLGLAFCFKADLLLLDEPCSNLDDRGIELYKTLQDQFGQNKTILVGSNQHSDELYTVERTLNVLDFKS